MMQSITVHLREKFLLKAAALWCSVALIAMGQDWLSARHEGYSFFLEESLLFKLFWICFIPLCYAALLVFQKVGLFVNRSYGWLTFPLLALTLSVIHIVVVSTAVFLVSYFFYSSTFSFSGNVREKFFEDFLLLLFIYNVVVFALSKLAGQNEAGVEKPRHILLHLGRQKVSLAIAEIDYVQTDAPYVALFVGNKKYLQNTTLQRLEAQLDPSQFVRVHRSTIVNISRVKTLTSRLNGDYDVHLDGGHEVRLSRSYRRSFQQHLDRSSL